MWYVEYEPSEVTVMLLQMNTILAKDFVVLMMVKVNGIQLRCSDCEGHIIPFISFLYS